MLRRTILSLSIALWPIAAHAQFVPDGGEAAAFIRKVSQDLPDIVGDAATRAERKRRLAPFLARIVDEPAVARFCLGRFWRVATQAQQQAYVALFRQVLLDSVTDRVDTYQAGRDGVRIGRPEPRPEGVYVPTTIQPPDAAPLRVTWLVVQTDAGWRIMDVIAEGVSLRLTQRSDYAAFLERHGFDIGALLEVLRQRAMAAN